MVQAVVKGQAPGELSGLPFSQIGSYFLYKLTQCVTLTLGKLKNNFTFRMIKNWNFCTEFCVWLCEFVFWVRNLFGSLRNATRSLLCINESQRNTDALHVPNDRSSQLSNVTVTRLSYSHMGHLGLKYECYLVFHHFELWRSYRWEAKWNIVYITGDLGGVGWGRDKGTWNSTDLTLREN